MSPTACTLGVYAWSVTVNNVSTIAPPFIGDMSYVGGTTVVGAVYTADNVNGRNVGTSDITISGGDLSNATSIESNLISTPVVESSTTDLLLKPNTGLGWNILDSDGSLKVQNKSQKLIAHYVQSTVASPDSVTVSDSTGDASYVCGAAQHKFYTSSVLRGTISDSAITSTVPISGTSITLSGLSDGVVKSTGGVLSGAYLVTNADLNGNIADSKLQTISTALKVSNSATTATSSNVNNSIIARDSSGGFSCGAISSSSIAVPSLSDGVVKSTGGVLSGAYLVTNADLNGSIADSKLQTISTALKVSNSATTATSSNVNNSIIARDSSGGFSCGAISSSSIAVPSLSDGVVKSTTGVLSGGYLVTNADLNGSISDSKLSTISTAGKVANSSTSAVTTSTNNTIVLRDSSAGFSCGTIVGTFNGKLLATTGSSGNPSITFNANNLTGFYSDSTPGLWSVVGGQDTFFYGNSYSETAFQLRMGTSPAEATPGYSWTGDTNTGMYNVTADNIGWSSCIRRLKYCKKIIFTINYKNIII